MADALLPDPAQPVLATYRLQLREGMDFAAATDVLDYLADLGVSHVYLSPILEATAGSAHGYDVVDPTRVDPVLGGDAGFRAFVAAAHAHGLGVVVDIVPNHLATDPDANAWWREVLAAGRTSRRAATFDITWDPPDRKLRDQVLLPVLGDHYGRVLEAGDIRLARTDQGIVVRVYDRSYPLDPATIDLDADPLDADADPLDADPLDADPLDDMVAELNADLGALHQLLERQHYRLARWRTAAEEVDYRRFFDITGLIGVRVERPEVFADTHACIAGWLDEGLVDGLRVDHPDGLAHPAGYVTDLRTLAGDDRWLVVEKILEPDEALPPWPVDGTTGYDFLAIVTGLLVVPDGYRQLEAQLAADRGQDLDGTEVDTGGTGADADDADPPFRREVHQAKLDALHQELASELRRLTDAFVTLVEDHLRYRDFTRRELHDVLTAALAGFPVYRTYVDPSGSASEADRRTVDAAMATARVRHPDIDPELFEVLRRALLAEPPFDDPAAGGLRRRFQQLSGAVMAKGQEDTALYRYPALLAVNEVGVDPADPAVSVEGFHEWCARTQRQWPATMLTLATHDTKRSDDVRARLAVLSELPTEWADRLAGWRRRAAPGWGDVASEPAWERLVFQTLVGAHPLPAGRAHPYVEKAAREAGARTSWLHEDADFEAALHQYVDGIYADDELLDDLDSFVADELRVDGWANALVQRLLLLTAPGVPDLYQGTERWSLFLVDPDNRQPVDFADHAQRLAQVTTSTAMPPLDDEGTTKLALTHRALRLRRQHPTAFGRAGGYLPLTVTGAAAEHVIAFGRAGQRDDMIVTVASRWPRIRRLVHHGWADTRVTLPPGSYVDVLTSSGPHEGDVELDRLLDDLPVALLARLGQP